MPPKWQPRDERGPQAGESYRRGGGPRYRGRDGDRASGRGQQRGRGNGHSVDEPTSREAPWASNDSYRHLPPPQVDNLSRLPERSQEIAQQLVSQDYECINCLEHIRLDAPTWSCTSCFLVLHLGCMRRWGRADTSDAGDTVRCPQCRTEHPAARVYKCFCGKATNPPYDPFIIPHSCGDTCGKARPFCAHRCTLQCHPGPCIECGVLVGPKSCPCGSTTYTYRCGRPDPKTTCDHVCGKLLNCGVHTCTRVCHNGDCDPCAVMLTTTCLCGKEERALPCGATFCCNAVCGKLLPCGLHHCTLPCHGGLCPPCPTDVSSVRTCPCGKTPLTTPRHSCADPIPLCGNACGKLLDCGRHKCEERCHAGPCPRCTRRIETNCRCRHLRKLVDCTKADGFRCTKPCATKLSCGRHYCKEVCCLFRNQAAVPAHQCPVDCARPLPCGHVCQEACHRGPCPPCIHFTTEPLYCHCRRTMLMPPQPCGTQAPYCAYWCDRRLPCGHRSKQHHCHFGDCPPCTYPVPKRCVGGHRIVENAPCSAETVSCDAQCGKTLPCGHSCLRKCHDGACVKEGEECQQLCSHTHESCGHKCSRKCHSGTACPPCNFPVDHKCKCGRIVVRIPCAEFRVQLDHFREEHPNDPFEIGCNTDCLYEQRLALLKSFGNGTKAPVATGRFFYSIFLWEVVEGDPNMVRRVEDQLKHFISSSETILALPPANAEKRALVHALANYYRIKTESVDSGVKRSCILKKQPYSAMPPILLSDAAKTPQQYDPRVVFQSFLTSTSEKDKNTTYFICLEGEHVNEIAVSQLLADVMGYFVYWDADPVDEKKRAVLLFTSPASRQEAYGCLRRHAAPFEFWIPT